MAEFFKKYFSKNFFCDILFIFVLSLVLTFASFLFIDGVLHFSIPFVLLKKPTILFMNFIPVFILMLIMYFAIGSVGGAFLSVGAMIFIMGVANQNKLFYRDDNLRITDIVLLKETLGMVKSGISIKLRWLYLVYPLILIACGRYLLKLDKYRPRALARVLGAILMCFVGFYTLTNFMTVRDTYWNNRIGLFHPYIEVERAKDRGMVYTFFYHYRDFFYEKPPVYDETTVMEKLDSYEESMPTDDEKPDIFLILGESFADLEEKGAKVDPSVYRSLRKLQDESISGLIQNYTYGGGTIEAERYIYQGAESFPPYIKNINTFVWMLKNEGYATKSMHPFTGKFYNRLNTNQFLGFDEFLHSENFFDEYFVNKEADYFPDRILFPLVLEDYRNRNKSKRYFNSVVTMQNHTPYSPEDNGIGDFVDRESFTGTDEEYNIANNYIYGVKDTADQLLNFTEELEKEKSPVVVIFYGDHLARLGEEGKVYESMGVDIGFDSPEGWLKHYTTPFIIWANSAAKEKIGDDMVGDIPTMSNYYLFAYALEKMGYKTPYIQYLSERRKEYPVDASSYISENGKLTADPSEKTQNDKLFHYMMQYYRLSHFSYDEVANKK